MKKIVKIVFGTVFLATMGYSVYTSQKSEMLSDLLLINIEALANNEIKPGDACYSDAKYDADKPKAIKCGTPCVYQPLNIPWFPSISYC